jgi:hypothetical protein
LKFAKVCSNFFSNFMEINQTMQLKETYWVIQQICSTSGFTWSAERGAAIDAAGEDIWNNYIKVHNHIYCIIFLCWWKW